MRALDKAGWSYVAYLVDIFPVHRNKPLRIIRWKDKTGLPARSRAGNM